MIPGLQRQNISVIEKRQHGFEPPFFVIQHQRHVIARLDYKTSFYPWRVGRIEQK